MAVEAARGCGYRQVGGTYLVGEGLSAPCDRLPVPIVPCGTCGEEPRFHRSISFINPLKLWGRHDEEKRDDQGNPIGACGDAVGCPVCYPTERGWLMWVGAEYSPQSFIEEARQLGVSKRIPGLPNDFKVGEDWVYLAYLHLIPKRGQFRLLPGDKPERGAGPGIFYVFKPQRVERIVLESDAQNEDAMAVLREAGLTPVAVPDDDPDHRPRKKRPAPEAQPALAD